MRHARREGGVQAVDVHRYVDRAAYRGTDARGPGTHVDHLHAEPVGLHALVRIHRPDPNLNETLGEPGLHDARERTRVRQPVAVEDVIEIRVRIELENGELRPMGAYRTNDRERDGVIAAE